MNISHNKLEHFFGLEALKDLDELEASDNGLQDLSGLQMNDQLQVLKVNQNEIQRMQFIEHLLDVLLFVKI